ncbi:MarR family winged helix-turn-helix transcriptional regulator [Clostridium oryzae]|uniref:MarR family protein n=1 Tax=Clostridium oryzae TaxID=1450648 RepID=A0A1V4IJM0_9CLOT|nr:MarR family transcriptional regulator [Clostridium oryzae]OPJ60198.1 MarR family protein [Clostridium oryzae]
MDKNFQIDNLPRKLLDVINRFNEIDSKARNFGTDETLHLSEIHLIEFIGDNEKLSVSEIARKKSVTKGAISKTLIRLEDKKLIVKALNPENKSQTIVSLTKKGWIAYSEHKKYHENINKTIFSCVQGKSEQDIKTIYYFLEQLENLL